MDIYRKSRYIWARDLESGQPQLGDELPLSPAKRGVPLIEFVIVVALLAMLAAAVLADLPHPAGTADGMTQSPPVKSANTR